MTDIYSMGVVALTTALVVLAICFLVKKSKNEKKGFDKIPTANHRDEKEKERVIRDIYDEDASSFSEDEIHPSKTINLDKLNGKEEGSFGTQAIADIEQETIKKHRVKRLVPKHGKISKDNFKEFAGTRILVAEDNIINQKVINGLLAESGIEIVMANDGQRALDILQNDTDFSIILMDAHMPIMNGFEATRKIRENSDYEHIVVVALSGDTATDDIKKMTDAGMEEQLEKPLRMDPLYDVFYAYTQKDDNAHDYVEIIDTKELNGEKGLETCGYDKVFYHEILNEFVNNYSDSATRLHHLFRENKMAQADVLLLDVVGITANIGADNLNQIAKELKEALQDTHEKSYLTIFEQYEERLNNLINDIKKYA
ncbi:response regulator [bacterium]|nr:response regulator [bacterium]MBU1995267.1 response regulator [bacterium]